MHADEKMYKVRCSAVRGAKIGNEIMKKHHIPQPSFFPHKPTMPGILGFVIPQREEAVPLETISSLRQSDEPTFVYMHGGSTVFAVGRLHDVNTLVNTTHVSDGGFKTTSTSSELTINHLPPVNGQPGLKFAREGDAGAPARLRDGRVLGYVMGNDFNSSTTYVSEAQRVLYMISKEFGGPASLLPCWRDY